MRVVRINENRPHLQIRYAGGTSLLYLWNGNQEGWYRLVAFLSFGSGVKIRVVAYGGFAPDAWINWYFTFQIPGDGVVTGQGTINGWSSSYSYAMKPGSHVQCGPRMHMASVFFLVQGGLSLSSVKISLYLEVPCLSRTRQRYVRFG